MTALLPGLYVALLTAGLAVALRRWYDPVPVRALAVFGLLVVVLFGPALFAGQAMLPFGSLRAAYPFLQGAHTPWGNWLQSDLIHQIAPWQLEVRRAVFDGRWPLWNMRSGAGMPLMGDPQAQVFQPLVAAAYPFPLAQAAGITAALRVLVALVFSFLLLRRQGLGEAAAVCGAVAYGLGGFLMVWLGWPIANVAALLPAVLYALARCDEPGGVRDHVLLFLSAIALLLAGHPETQLYALTFAGLFLLSRGLARRLWAERSALLARCALTLALAGAAASPVLLSIHGYLPHTYRAFLLSTFFSVPGPEELWRNLVQPETLAFWGGRATERLLVIAAPRAFGDLREYWGADNLIENGGGFAGTAALLAAAAALLPFRARRRFPQERLAGFALLACLLLLAQPPGFDRLFARIPLIGATALHQHHRTLLIVVFCVAYLAACEIERQVRGEGRRGAVLLAGAALAGLLAWGYFAHPSPHTGHVLIGRAFAVQLAALVLAAGLLLAVRPGPSPPGPLSHPHSHPPGRGGTNSLFRFRSLGGWERGSGGEGPAPAALRHWLPWALCAVLAGELLWLHLPLNPPAPAELSYPSVPPVEFLQRSLGRYRMMGMRRTFLANIPIVYGLRDVRIDNPSLPAAYANLTSSISRRTLFPQFGRPESAIYDLLGVRYVMTRPGLRLPFRRVFQNRDGWVYERPNPLPVLFLPARARMHRSGPWLSWVERNTDFAARALVKPTPEQHKHWRSRPRTASTLELVSWRPALLRARARLGEPRLLASSVYQDGHWHLLVQRTKVSTTYANGPLVAAWLPAGELDLHLVYRPRAFVAGCVLSALALAFAAVRWLPRPRLRGVLS
ncbi:MAG TPA: hypothetical protein VF756_03265 [Thermoanaerobaculia bacterium]